jgi:NADPH2 dehydrogenase
MADPKPAFSYLVSEIARRHPSLAYIHLVEPRVAGPEDREVRKDEVRALRNFPPFMSGLTLN